MCNLIWGDEMLFIPEKKHGTCIKKCGDEMLPII